MTLDIIIPTIRAESEVANLIEEIKRTAGCDVRVLATCQQVSAAINRNIGLSWAENDIIIMVDDDMERFPQGWAVKMANVLQTRPNCVMVSPQLAAPNGEAGPMMGNVQVKRTGVSVATQRKLPTACVAVRNNGIRFDEAYIGSGWEDDDYCAQLRLASPCAEFCVCHEVWVVHRNEQKNQTGLNWVHNEDVFMRKWIDRAGSRLRNQSRKLCAIYKVYRGGEWFEASMDSIYRHVDGIVVIQATRPYRPGPAFGENTSSVVKSFAEKHPQVRIITETLDVNEQGKHYQRGLDIIATEFGNDTGVLVIDTDEIWPDETIPLVANSIRQGATEYYVSRLYDYIKRPTWRASNEAGHFVVGLASPKPSIPPRTRFGGWQARSHTKFADSIRLHHFTLVRSNESEIVDKMANCAHADGAYHPNWMRDVWDKLPAGTNLHPSPRWEYVWPKIEIVSEDSLPEAVLRCNAIRNLSTENKS